MCNYAMEDTCIIVWTWMLHISTRFYKFAFDHAFQFVDRWKRETNIRVYGAGDILICMIEHSHTGIPVFSHQLGSMEVKKAWSRKRAVSAHPPVSLAARFLNLSYAEAGADVVAACLYNGDGTIGLTAHAKHVVDVFECSPEGTRSSWR